MAGDAKTCPVCEGRKTVPAGFYEPERASDANGTETCRSCGGRGFILTESTAATSGSGDPLDLTYRQ